jgi:hypothetical protein
MRLVPPGDGPLWAGSIGGIVGCFSPGKSQILPLCRVRSSSRTSLYLVSLISSVAG